jgi:hypothetical protein
MYYILVTGFKYTLHLAARAKSNQMFKKPKRMIKQVLKNGQTIQLASI